MFLISSIFGLPAHPLFVHGAVVIVPIAVVALAATGWNASWRRSYLLPVLLLAVAGAVSAWLASESGEGVEHTVRNAAQAAGAERPRFGDHPEEGENAYRLAVIFAIAVVAFFGVDLWSRTGARKNVPSGLARWAPLGMYAVAVIPGIIGLIMVISAGHSGAELVWKDVGNYIAASK